MTTRPDAPRCPRCGAPRAAGPECPACGVIYAKARPRAAPPSAPAPDQRAPSAEPWPGPDAASAPWPPAGDWPAPAEAWPPPEDAWPARPASGPPATWDGARDDARRELLVRAVAPPAALLVAWAIVASDTGHFLLRTFLSMWIHELGHAVAAWFSGHGAFPGPWRTPISSGRMPVVILALAGALAWAAWSGWRAGRRGVVAAAAAGLVLQLVCTTLPASAARALFAFAGDAGCLVLGALLVATIWTDPEGRLGRGSLRWGFLGIGAASLVDALHTWVGAWRDPRLLPLGEIEGVGLSDASSLLEVHGWSAHALSSRYVALGAACLAALGVGYAVALRRARARVRALEAGRGR